MAAAALSEPLGGPHWAGRHTGGHEDVLLSQLPKATMTHLNLPQAPFACSTGGCARCLVAAGSACSGGNQANSRRQGRAKPSGNTWPPLTGAGVRRGAGMRR